MVAFYILFIGIFVFGISAVLFKKSKRKFLISGIATAILSPLIYFAFVICIIYSLTTEKRREFHREDWILVGEDINKRLSRFEMVDDLIDSKIVVKKDSLEVIKILGAPDSRDKENNKWTYEAGTGGGFGFVDHYLDIYYDENFEAVKVEHRRIED
ncbi:hypothetical protein ASG31_00270 [Chryseobacterium sp. Leaf404]|uniref:hypothetical protein n=1 Tax=unclassified Chryseobacterium TaxID=2593645 RepID=UPI0006F5BAF4|nr:MULTISPECIES: hypothetical protein [unclassified Chryseobacterium]KQT21817.1 hypothetical protein ASG31_00270 [Chryseobacterium sp. Leaf404]